MALSLASGVAGRARRPALAPARAALAPAAFLDKDGTLLRDVPYNVDPARMCLLPGVAEGLRRLACSGYQLVVISNQPGVALGRFGESALANVHQRLQELFAACGVALSAFYYCPHHPQGQVAAYASTCRCRKPQPGLLLQAARALDIDLARSWMIGDILDDVEAGRRAGCRTVLINNGNETQWRWSPWRIPDAMTADFASASLAACTAARPHAARLAAEG